MRARTPPGRGLAGREGLRGGFLPGLLLLLLLLLSAGRGETGGAKRANIVLILTDDQDLVLGGMVRLGPPWRVSPAGRPRETSLRSRPGETYLLAQVGVELGTARGQRE